MTPVLLFAFTLAAQSGVARPSNPVMSPPPAASVPQPATDWPYRFSDDDYPARAIRGDEQGTTRYRVEIGPDGRVSRCAITGSSGSSVLDSETCRIVTRRARFTPARDGAGNPVPDAREGEVTWRMEGDD